MRSPTPCVYASIYVSSYYYIYVLLLAYVRVVEALSSTTEKRGPGTCAEHFRQVSLFLKKRVP